MQNNRGLVVELAIMERGRREFRKSIYLWNTRVSDCGGLNERDKEARQDLDKSRNVEKKKKKEKKKRNIPRKMFFLRPIAHLWNAESIKAAIATLSSHTLQNYLRSIIPYLVQRRPLTGPTYNFTGRNVLLTPIIISVSPRTNVLVYLDLEICTWNDNCPRYGERQREKRISEGESTLTIKRNCRG